MSRFKKRPMEVDAVPFSESLDKPDWVIWDQDAQSFYVQGDGVGQPLQMRVRYGDWLITGESGAHYGVPHEDFLRIYEPV